MVGRHPLAWIPPAVGTVTGLICVALYWTWIARPAVLPAPRLATDEGSLAEARAMAVARTVDLEGRWVAGPASAPGPDWGLWPGFRGPAGDNHARGSAALAEQWPLEGPPVLWTVPMGEGHAGPAVWQGRVYVLDYDEALAGDALRCLSLETGEELWRRWYYKPTKRNHGISRTVPAVAYGKVVTLGPQCQVLCVEAESGAFLWGRDLPSTDGTTVPLWYTGQCPLIDPPPGSPEATESAEPVVVLAPCGPAVSLMALDLATGRVVWAAPNPMGWGMSHGSIAVLAVDGVRMFVYAALGGVLGVGADGAERGRILWWSDAWKPSIQAPTPLPLDDGRLLLTAGYGAGAAIMRVRRDVQSETGWSAELERTFDRRIFGSEQQTPILHDGLLYGVLPADGGAARRELVAMRPDGERLWASGGDDRFGLGPYLLVNGNRMLLLADDGVLTLASVGREGYRRLARAKLLQHRDAWGPMAFVDGRLLLRDDRTLICIDLRERR